MQSGAATVENSMEVPAKIKNRATGNSLAVQWLGLHAFTAEGPGSISGRGTKISQAVWHGK